MGWKRIKNTKDKKKKNKEENWERGKEEEKCNKRNNWKVKNIRRKENKKMNKTNGQKEKKLKTLNKNPKCKTGNKLVRICPYWWKGNEKTRDFFLKKWLIKYGVSEWIKNRLSEKYKNHWMLKKNDNLKSFGM